MPLDGRAAAAVAQLHGHGQVMAGGDGGDLLIGMDIITRGDFSITNKGGRTIFSFRFPSLVATDFVAEHKDALARAQALTARPAPPRPKRPGKRFGKNKR